MFHCINLLFIASQKEKDPIKGQKEVAYVVVGGIGLLLVFYAFHCTWVSICYLTFFYSSFNHLLILLFRSHQRPIPPPPLCWQPNKVMVPE